MGNRERVRPGKAASFGGRGARDPWAAREALTVMIVVLSGWMKHYPADLLTVGLRDAYYAGLALAVPIGKQELGWAMTDPPEPP